MKSKSKLKPKLFQNKLTVKKSHIHGYGVFADKAIKRGEIVEECYAILTKAEDDILGDYFFDTRGKNAVLTGFGWIYNHSEDPNCFYMYYPKKRLMVFRADRAIKKGEEIYVSYGDDWFSSRDLEPKTVGLKKVDAKKSKKKKASTLKKKTVKKASKKKVRTKKTVSRKRR
jgi:SET domain-containing protein